MDLNQGLFHIWSKFGDYSVGVWEGIARINSSLMDKDTQPHTHADTRKQRQYLKTKIEMRNINSVYPHMMFSAFHLTSAI